MSRVQYLASAVTSLHIQATVARQLNRTAVEATAPPPQAAASRPRTRHLKAAHQGSITSIAFTPPRDTNLAAFLSKFTFMDHSAGNSSHSRLNRLATLQLGDLPPLVVCVKTPDPHIRVL